MGGDVKVTSEGIGKGTSFIFQMKAVSKLTHEQVKEHRLRQSHNKNVSNVNVFKEIKLKNEIESKYKKIKQGKRSDLNVNRFSKFIM